MKYGNLTHKCYIHVYENVHVEVMCIYAFYKFWLFTH